VKSAEGLGELTQTVAALQDTVAGLAAKECGCDRVVGLEADFEKGVFTRLAGGAGKTGGADFDGFRAFGGRRRCNVLDDGTITAWYGEPGYAEDGSNGQVMVYQPKFYYMVSPLELEPIEGSVGYHLRKARYYVSDTPRDGFKVHPWFVVDGRELPYRLTGAYAGCLYDVSEHAYILDDAQVGDFTAGAGDKLSSVAGAKPISGLTQPLTRPFSAAVAANRGAGWTQRSIQGASAAQLLMAIEYGTFNMQAAIGMGVVNKPKGEGNEAEPTGQTAALGSASGMAEGANGLTSVTYRGEENLWGNLQYFADGVNFLADVTGGRGVPYIADHDFADSVTGEAYRGAGFTLADTYGYISAFGYGSPAYDWLFLPSESAGDENLPVGDYARISALEQGLSLPLLGGSWDIGDSGGAFHVWPLWLGAVGGHIGGSRLEFAPGA
jgi:hypothetical protein